MPHAPKVKTLKGATVQGAHSLNINPVGLRAEAVENGVRLWEPFAGAGCSGMLGGGVHSQGLHLARQLSLGQEGGCHFDPQIDEEIPDNYQHRLFEDPTRSFPRT